LVFSTFAPSQAPGQTGWRALRHFPFTSAFTIMAKSTDARKEKKKEPALTPKEKKAAKDEKKVVRDRKQD